MSPWDGSALIAYASYSDIQTRLAFIPTFTATSKPNATQAHTALIDASNQLDAALSVSDYRQPIPASASAAWELLRTWAGLGGAAKVAFALPQGTRGNHAEALGEEWKALLKDLREGRLALPGVDKDGGVALVRSPESPVTGEGCADPVFTRCSIER